MKRLASAIALFVIACAAPERPAEVTSAPAPPPSPAPTPAAQEIYIDSVTAANPLVVKGRARTFENSVSLRVRDAAGELLTETHVTSAGEMGHHNPFEAQIFVTRNPNGRVTVEAFEYSAKDGSVRSLTSKTVDYNVEPIEAKLIVPDGDCTRFKTVTRELPKSPAMARLLVEALIAEGSTFPKEAAVRSVNLRDGVLTVDFNERLQNVGGACAATAIRESVARTLMQLPTVKRVVITAAGSEKLALQP